MSEAFEISKLNGHKGSVQHVTTSPSGSLLATSSDEDQTVRLWDLRVSPTTAVRCVKFGAHAAGLGDDDSTLGCTCFGASDEELYIGCCGSIVRYDSRASSSIIEDGKTLPCLFTADDEVNEISYCPGIQSVAGGSPLVAAADDTGSVTVIKVSDKSVYRTFDKQHTNICSSLKWHPSSKTCLISSSLDCTVAEYDVHTKRSLARDKFKAPPGMVANPPLVHCIDVSRNGQTVAIALGDGEVVLSSWKGLRRRVTMEGHMNATTSVCFMRDSAHVVSGSLDESVILWNTKGEAVKKCADLGKVNWVAASPINDTIFVASSSSSVHVLSIQ